MSVRVKPRNLLIGLAVVTGLVGCNATATATRPPFPAASPTASPSFTQQALAQPPPPQVVAATRWIAAHAARHQLVMRTEWVYSRRRRWDVLSHRRLGEPGATRVNNLIYLVEVTARDPSGARDYFISPESQAKGTPRPGVIRRQRLLDLRPLGTGTVFTARIHTTSPSIAEATSWIARHAETDARVVRTQSIESALPAWARLDHFTIGPGSAANTVIYLIEVTLRSTAGLSYFVTAENAIFGTREPSYIELPRHLDLHRYVRRHGF